MADVAITPPDPLSSAVAQVATTLGHGFGNPEHLRLGLTHASRLGAQATANDRRERSNERLEFLGDAMLGAALVWLLYQRFPDAQEGTLARWKSNLASRTVLAQRLDAFELTVYGAVGQQMGSDPWSWPDSVKANLLEGIIGAIWLDGGWPALVQAVERLMAPLLEDPAHAAVDARQRLQEHALATARMLPTYAVERTGGTDHAPEFTATVTLADRQATGQGVSRRKAEAAAAEAWLAELAVNGSGSSS